MSSGTPTKGHRQTRSAMIPGIAASSQNPKNPHHQAHAPNSHFEPQNYNSDSNLRPSSPPRTPRKDNQLPSQTPSNSTASGTGSKQKSRKKNPPKNVLTSPSAARKDRHNSPFSGMKSAGIPPAKPMNTPSTAAYAGPTFHASPAPSALPIPSFYSKSVPESPAPKGLKSKFLKDGHLDTPPHGTTSVEQTREESPLDFFFKADREEKARALSANQTAGTNGPFQPPTDSARKDQASPAGSRPSQPRQGSANRLSSGGGIFAMDLDSEKEAGAPFGPAFSTPYSERINAARSNQQPRASGHQATGSQHVDKSEALKAYLFSGILAPTKEEGTAFSPSSSQSYQQPSAANNVENGGPPQRPSYNGHQYGSDSTSNRLPGRSGLRQEIASPNAQVAHSNNGPHTNSPAQPQRQGVAPQANNHSSIGRPSSHQAGRSADLLGMEDSLRKILKLDSPGGQLPTVASAPAIVGGRPQRTNEMQNGFMR